MAAERARDPSRSRQSRGEQSVVQALVLNTTTFAASDKANKHFKSAPSQQREEPTLETLIKEKKRAENRKRYHHTMTQQAIEANQTRHESLVKQIKERKAAEQQSGEAASVQVTGGKKAAEQSGEAASEQVAGGNARRWGGGSRRVRPTLTSRRLHFSSPPTQDHRGTDDSNSYHRAEQQ